MTQAGPMRGSPGTFQNEVLCPVALAKVAAVFVGQHVPEEEVTSEESRAQKWVQILDTV